MFWGLTPTALRSVPVPNPRDAVDCSSATPAKNRAVPFFMTQRLDAIEEKLAHLERAVAEISDVVARQQKQLDAALDRNQRLMEKISAIETDFGPSATAHEKPPHY